MRFLVLALVMSAGCSSPSIVSPTVDPATSSASQGSAPSSAPLVATATSAAAPADRDASGAGNGTPDASATALHGPMGKPSSLGGGIPGECVNCPPTGCPKSCEALLKGK